MITSLNERMIAWFTPSMIAPTTILLQRLEELAAEFDAGITTGRFDEIMLESDKIQAELWRRSIHNET